MLNKDLIKEDESNFESLLNQSMYLCLSFGRVGADMRCVLTPLFRENLLKSFHNSLERANAQFEAQMKSYKVPNIKNVPRPVNENMAPSPPETLLDYYPLAEYCNGLLITLNSLRITAPLNIVKEVYKAFEDSLTQTVKVLIAFYHREQQAFTDVERQNFVSYCVCFTEDFVPYIVKCLSMSFPSTAVAEQLGVTLSVLQDSKVLHIDRLKLCEQLDNITSIIT
ncbi:Conserved oligomeric Golgi complex subunit 8 [Eumeta japonica]|uniref:Conserved oligomeric Golgi complex subunit 8 n=1 Tax=Eumeta variegata TaxID=151549 RepID=A0A4C1U7N7_EUMVA|nr:Conserved oligomeric Golgi complex subunit 8 [Eumeta japonica]